MNMHMPTPIVDRESYNKSLRRSLGSKLFFVDKMPVSEVGMWVDFGCADGSLLKALDETHESLPHYVGVDRDPAQRLAASLNFPVASYYRTLSLIPPPWAYDKAALILSSVMHEVLSEVTGPVFWAMVEQFDFDYIVVRDFALDEECYQKPTPKEWQEEALAAGYFKELRDMGLKYGSVHRLHNFMHFLLKYPYRENWERELAENYVPLSSQAMGSLFTESGKYEITHWQPTTTQHFKDRVERDFGITQTPTTHIEMVLERRKA